jgi:hypothetical protein
MRTNPVDRPGRTVLRPGDRVLSLLPATLPGEPDILSRHPKYRLKSLPGFV